MIELITKTLKKEKDATATARRKKFSRIREKEVNERPSHDIKWTVVNFTDRALTAVAVSVLPKKGNYGIVPAKVPLEDNLQ